MQIYQYLVDKGRIKSDKEQIIVLEQLEELNTALHARPAGVLPPPKPQESAPTSSFFGSWFGGAADNKQESITKYTRDPGAPRGFYLWGEPGCGKTFMMDIAYRCAPMGSKKRTHFNSFMLDVHHRIFKWRQSRSKEELGDPIVPLARALASDATFLCFDEFQVVDVADAMILQRLFAELFALGTVVICTSNRPPRDLYLNGIQRDRFLPFIDLLQEQCTVVAIGGDVDYRKLGSMLSTTYFTPLGETASQHMDAAFTSTLRGDTEKPTTITVAKVGREIRIPRAGNGVARFTFDQICRANMSAADYIAIAAAFHTIFIDSIPKLKLDDINAIRRLITLIDELYQSRTRVVISADALPLELFLTGDKGKYDEVFAFDRTVSRLMEMQSQEYQDQIEWKRENEMRTFAV